MDIAAFLGFSLLVRCGFLSAVLKVDDLEAGTALDFWASDSGRLRLAASSDICLPMSSEFGIGGGRISLSSGLGPTMEVSGMPVFRGGAENDSGRL